MKKVLYITLLAVLVGCAHKETTPDNAMKNKKLASFNIILIDSTKSLNTSNIPSGTPTVFFYFSPECIYCRAQMREIIANASSLPSVKFYAITTWPYKEMVSFYNQYKLGNYSNIVVGLDTAAIFANEYNTTSVPYIAVFDSEKKIRKTFMGRVSIDDIKRSLVN